MKKTILASLLAVATLAPLAAFASDGTITFTGSVTATTCTINGGTPNIAVTLPKVSTTTLAAAGNTAGATNFTINLTGCTTGGSALTNVRVFFESGANVDASGRLNNTATGATAEKYVQLQLLNSTGGVIVAGAASGSQNSGTYAPISATGTAALTYGARYYATAAASGGVVSSSVTYSLEYQ